MQLTSPAFLFLFLPISLALVLLVPRGARKIMLALVSATWLVLANYGNVWGLLQLAFPILLSALLALQPHRHKALTAIGVALPILSLLAARTLAAFSLGYSFPTGLLFITLSAISLTLDRANGTQKDTPADIFCYLLFFPTATLGPIIRYQQFLQLMRHASPSPGLFCDGIRIFMLGYVKRIALAAVFYRTLESILDLYGALPLSSLPFFLLISLFYFYFLVSGTADMARGISAMYGLRLPRDRINLLRCTAPHEMFYGIFHSLHRYINAYLLRPAERRFKGKVGKVFSVLLLFAVYLLCLDLHPSVWLLALPMLASAIFCNLQPPKQKQHRRALRVLFVFLSGFFCSILSLFAAAGTLSRAIDLLASIFSFSTARFYHFYFLLADIQYVLIALIAFLVLLVLTQMLRSRHTKLGEKTRFALSLVTTVMLFLGFVFTLLFVMPQFPQYAGTLFLK